YATKVPKLLLNRYLVGGLLGEGSYGKVKLCVDIDDQRRLAVKIITLRLVKKLPRGVENADAMKRLEHKNVAKLFADFLSNDGAKRYLVMEWAVCSLHDLQTKGLEPASFSDTSDGELPTCRHLPESQARCYFAQLLNGVEYLHSMRLVHKDLKPGNLLLTEVHEIKITDFGVCEWLSELGPTADSADDDVITGSQATPAIQPPEVATGCRRLSGRKLDMYCCGVSLYFMVSGQVPYTGRSVLQIYEAIAAGSYTLPDWVSKPCRELIAELMSQQPGNRPSIEQARKYRWMLEQSKPDANWIQPTDVIEFESESVAIDRIMSQYRLAGQSRSPVTVDCSPSAASAEPTIKQVERKTGKKKHRCGRAACSSRFLGNERIDASNRRLTANRPVSSSSRDLTARSCSASICSVSCRSAGESATASADRMKLGGVKCVARIIGKMHALPHSPLWNRATARSSPNSVASSRRSRSRSMIRCSRRSSAECAAAAAGLHLDSLIIKRRQPGEAGQPLGPDQPGLQQSASQAATVVRLRRSRNGRSRRSRRSPPGPRRCQQRPRDRRGRRRCRCRRSALSVGAFTAVNTSSSDAEIFHQGCLVFVFVVVVVVRHHLVDPRRGVRSAVLPDQLTPGGGQHRVLRLRTRPDRWNPVLLPEVGSRRRRVGRKAGNPAEKKPSNRAAAAAAAAAAVCGGWKTGPAADPLTPPPPTCPGICSELSGLSCLLYCRHLGALSCCTAEIFERYSIDKQSCTVKVATWSAMAQDFRFQYVPEITASSEEFNM
uniref:non-specific serine/threonine protein kinase n=1 Tax=Macrostomum lignano TaxID=282301 RepID=A0A1I8GGH0_9PLAT